MKFLKKAVSALLAAVMAVTMMFAGSVTAGAASDDVYVDGAYDSEGQYCIRIGGYGVREFMDYTDFMPKGAVLSVALKFDDMLFMIMIECISQGGDSVAYMGYPYVNLGDGLKYDEKVASMCYIGRLENKRDEGILIVFPKGSKAIDRLASAKKVSLYGGIYITDNDTVSETVLNLPAKTVTTNFDGLKKETSSEKTDSSKDKPSTLKTTTLTAKKSGEKIKLSWKKVDGAEKYQIYYREKGESKYKKLATVSGSKTSYSTSKLDKNKTYEFKIRSYAESNGKKVYSKFSKVKTVTAK